MSCGTPIPEGSEYPMLQDSGPKDHLGYGSGDQSPGWVLGPSGYDYP